MLHCTSTVAGPLRALGARLTTALVLCAAVVVLCTTSCTWDPIAPADNRRIALARAQIDTFLSALAAYRGDNGLYPTTSQGLSSLRVRPSDLSTWRGPYLRQDIPSDPWGYPYVYRFPGGHGEVLVVLSYGADHRLGGQGANADIVGSPKAQSE